MSKSTIKMIKCQSLEACQTDSLCKNKPEYSGTSCSAVSCFTDLQVGMEARQGKLLETCLDRSQALRHTSVALKA